MNKAIFIAALLIVAAPASTQVGDVLILDAECSFFGEDLPKNVTLFDSEAEAENVIEEIVRATGVSKTFIVKAAGVPNAAAAIEGEERYILYEPYFMRDVKKQTGSRWGPISIMAHEIGHHLNGHTLRRTGSRPKSELEADYFSGFALQRMGATLDDARLAMSALGSSSGTATHPARNERLVAITQGWSAAERIKPPAGENDEQKLPTMIQTEPPATLQPTPQPTPVRFPSGTPTTACGCWGFVQIGQTRASAYCASGLETPRMCLGFCQLGGSPWQSVCM